MGNKIIVIGGGAAGFFGAITAAANDRSAEVIILEKSDKLLSKVKISGGGRCNVTHACFENSQLLKNYPRGNKFLKDPFKYFNATDTIRWFESKGVKIKKEEDGRMFPITDDSQTIIDCLLKEASLSGVKIEKKAGVKSIIKKEKGFELEVDRFGKLYADKILIASGGYPKNESYSWIREPGIKVEPPVPSLFTFNVPDSPYKDLSGVSMPDAEIKILGTKLDQRGPLLITHWGFSGPAVIKLSAWGAKELASINYSFKIHIKWVGDHKEEQVREDLYKIRELHKKKVISVNPLWNIPLRLWKRITESAEIDPDLRWVDLPKKQFNKLIEGLIRSEFKVNGKTTFKEEFVTCGGVDVAEIDPQTMESRKSKGLYVAGEILNIDGITGGFNFQNAWTTGYLAGKNMVLKKAGE
jgi:predicted Rossmann fold flavoprotein